VRETNTLGSCRCMMPNRNQRKVPCSSRAINFSVFIINMLLQHYFLVGRPSSRESKTLAPTQYTGVLQYHTSTGGLVVGCIGHLHWPKNLVKSMPLLYRLQSRIALAYPKYYMLYCTPTLLLHTQYYYSSTLYSCTGIRALKYSYMYIYISHIRICVDILQ
jgi:hypothetical protein